VSGSSAPGLIIAAPASNSGKTFFTLSLLRLLAIEGVLAQPAKVGPDYIDPAFHRAASGRTCYNLDTWAMRPSTLAHVLGRLSDDGQPVVCEGVMGLFDGARGDNGANDGSTASLARLTGWPVVLIVDVSAQAASVAALVRGFAAHIPGVDIVGVIFNRVAGVGHRAILLDAMSQHLPHIPVIACLPREPALCLPERHLGLVQAQEIDDLEPFLIAASAWLRQHVDLGAFTDLFRPSRALSVGDDPVPVPPLGQHIAIADDAAFTFTYAVVAEGWRAAGAEISHFSPLAGEGPDPAADAVYLPGGYPELHAGRLAGNGFLSGLRAAAASGATVFGECGGYMVLGQGLIDGNGTRHEMAGLLPLETSFAERRLHLGYRRLELQTETPLGDRGRRFHGHEFHYASIVTEETDNRLFVAADAAGTPLGAMGSASGTVFGSFAHLIDRSD